MSSARLLVGVDAVEVDRIRRLLERRPAARVRLFTETEQAYGSRYADPAPRLAARFAAKEATMKALGVGIGAFAFRDVEVVRGEAGEPGLNLTGVAAAIASKRGVTEWAVSLTHTEREAQAVVLAVCGS